MDKTLLHQPNRMRVNKDILYSIILFINIYIWRIKKIIIIIKVLKKEKGGGLLKRKKVKKGIEGECTCTLH